MNYNNNPSRVATGGIPAFDTTPRPHKFRPVVSKNESNVDVGPYVDEKLKAERDRCERMIENCELRAFTLTIIQLVIFVALTLLQLWYR